MAKTEFGSFTDQITYDQVPESHPARLFYDHWRELCGIRKFALKADFDPCKIPRLLGNIGIVKLEYTDGELDLLLTLAGERLMDLSAIKGPGSFRHDYFSGKALTERLSLYEGMAKKEQSAFYRMTVPFEGREFQEIIVSMCPFSSDGVDVDYMFLMVESA